MSKRSVGNCDSRRRLKSPGGDDSRFRRVKSSKCCSCVIASGAQGGRQLITISPKKRKAGLVTLHWTQPDSGYGALGDCVLLLKGRINNHKLMPQ